MSAISTESPSVGSRPHKWIGPRHIPSDFYTSEHEKHHREKLSIREYCNGRVSIDTEQMRAPKQKERSEKAKAEGGKKGGLELANTESRCPAGFEFQTNSTLCFITSPKCLQLCEISI